MKYNMAFYCKSVPFTDETIRLETSLGGSESALVYMTRDLQKAGHSVTVFTDIPDPKYRGAYDGVRWWDFSQMSQACESIEWDIFISLRTYDIMHQTIRAKYRAIWNQDVLSLPNEFFSSLWGVDELIYVSEWQRNQYESRLPEEVKPLGFVTKNGIDLEAVDAAIKDVKRDMNQLIYISRPERGLKPLLQIFPKMREERPELRLKIARYYSMYEKNPNIAEICKEADAAIAQTEGVEYLGNLNKAELYKAIASSALMVYPGVPTFDETSCIAALEAQACRTPLICTDRGGLSETMTYDAGVRVWGDAYTEDYQQDFIEEAFDLLEDPNAYMMAQQAGRDWVSGSYEYSHIAAEWETHFDKFFNDRLEVNKDRVFENLVHHDDMVAARKLSERFGMFSKLKSVQPIALDNATPESFADEALAPEHEMQTNKRLGAGLAFIEDLPTPNRILDFACGNGAMAVMLKRQYPMAEVIAIDYSASLCETGRQFANSHGVDIDFQTGSFEAIDGEFDLIFCGEFLEHNEDYAKVINRLESHLSNDGWLLWTVPSGPFIEIMNPPPDIAPATERYHRIHWEHETVSDVFLNKFGFALTYFFGMVTFRGSHCGHWLIRHQAGETGEINWEKKIATTRPFQKLTVAMITKNNEKYLRSCLESVKYVADEIVIADQQSTDRTVEIAGDFGAKIITIASRWPDAPNWAPDPGSFEWARNESIKDVSGDWILWIDTDEELIGAPMLRQHLNTRCYEGFVLRQNHLILDAPNRHDKPIRLFRNGQGYRFYGIIHEHCQKSLNEPISPVYELSNTDIVHYGYITEARRQEKCKRRNIQLLLLDRQLNPDRELGLALLAREYLNMIHWEFQDYGAMTVEAKNYAQQIVNIYTDRFSDMKQTLYPIMFPVYQKALEYLNIGTLVSVKVRVADPKDPNAIRVLSAKELSRHMASETARVIGELQYRGVFQSEPQSVPSPTVGESFTPIAEMTPLQKARFDEAVTAEQQLSAAYASLLIDEASQPLLEEVNPDESPMDS